MSKVVEVMDHPPHDFVVVPDHDPPDLSAPSLANSKVLKLGRDFLSSLAKAHETMLALQEFQSKLREIQGARGLIWGIGPTESSIVLWSVVECDDRTVASKIYQQERNLFERFPQLRFDFKVLSDGSGILEYLPDNFVYSTL